ncbi:thiamine pyrophosphate-binding protein [Allopusillimonas soli]|uniref:Thiamine pyrophosphate-binding protein n=1 Tax=Allopusillimonas soli TaxID=659016 RepID=A0A853FGF4_9BURK|nr:thiamine pyrophosphate-binding protein [Allopusillimonas soli]TEA71801.1 thiamine pyrophosphate-binding protein [Allopusillimonas soli]
MSRHSRVRGGWLVAQTLATKKTEVVFTMSGGFINPVIEGLVQHGVRVVNAPDERIAGHLADGWARSSRAPAVCLAGPEGMGNAVPAMLEAFGQHSPVLFITGSSTIKRMGQGGFKEIDHVRVADPLTKYSVLVTDGNRIPEFINKAYEICGSGNPGPVHISIPTDLLYSSFDNPNKRLDRPFSLTAQPEHLAWPDPGEINTLFDKLEKAKRPVVIAGNGVWWGRAETELARFASRYDVPVLIVPYHQALFEGQLPYYFGLADIHQYPPAEAMLRDADLILSIGCRLDNMLNFGNPPLVPKTAELICVNGSITEVADNHAADVNLLGHPRIVLSKLAEAKEGSEPVTREWLKTCRQDRSRWIGELQELIRKESDSRPMHPLALSVEVINAIGSNDFLVIDGGDTHYWAEMALNIAAFNGKPIRGVFHPGPNSLIGCGISFGMALKLMHPTSNVVVLSGDGAFLSGGFGIELAFNENVPITVVIDNNRGLSSIEQQQRRIWDSGEPCGTAFRDVPFDGLFKGLGGHGITIDEPSEIAHAIREAIASNLPACVNVRTKGVISPLVEALTDRRAKSSIE